MPKSFKEELDIAMEAKRKAEPSISTSKRQIPLPFRRFNKGIPALFKEDEGNAGYDLFARLEKPLTLSPGEVALIPLNVATQMDIRVVGLLFQRSSTFRKWGVQLTNSVGVIDSLFSGNEDEWAAEFQNVTDEFKTINNGDKICQAVFLNLAPVTPVEQDKLNGANRGGFGTSFDNAEARQFNTKEF